MRPKRPCAVPTCPNFQPCEKHRKERKKDPAQAKHYSSGRWQKIRAIVRANQPLCMKCKRKPSRIVDHISGDWRDNRLENLQALCDACNNSKTGKQHREKQV